MMKAFNAIPLLTGILLFAACTQKSPPPTPIHVANGRIAIEVGDISFQPTLISAPKKKQLTLVFTRTSTSPCGESVVIKGHDIRKDLPLNQPVEINLTPQEEGRIRFACGMDMMKGAIVIQ